MRGANRAIPLVAQHMRDHQPLHPLVEYHRVERTLEVRQARERGRAQRSGDARVPPIAKVPRVVEGRVDHAKVDGEGDKGLVDAMQRRARDKGGMHAAARPHAHVVRKVDGRGHQEGRRYRHKRRPTQQEHVGREARRGVRKVGGAVHGGERDGDDERRVDHEVHVRRASRPPALASSLTRRVFASVGRREVASLWSSTHRSREAATGRTLAPLGTLLPP